MSVKPNDTAIDSSLEFEASMHWPGFQGRTCFVLGGASGMGAATVQALAQQGASVAVIDAQGELAEQGAAQVREQGGQAFAATADFQHQHEIESALDQATQALGHPHVLIYTAGLSRFKKAEDLQEPDWAAALAVNLSGAWYAAKAVTQGMIEQGGGKMLFIGSAAALSAIPQGLPYSTAKHGLIGLTRNLAVDLGPHNINVNCICPSTVDTPMLREATKPIFREQIRQRIPLGRLGTLDDITNAILFMTSDLSGWISGVALPVDGGLTCCLRAHHYE